MPDREKFRVVTDEDIPALLELEIPFHYKENIREEINGQSSTYFRWVVYEDNHKITAFHRSMVVSGWGFLGGVYVVPFNSDIWLCNNIVRYAIEDLSTITTEGLITWDDSPPSVKTPAMQRFGFRVHPELVYRFIFGEEAISSLRKQRIESELIWRQGCESDYREIIHLAEMGSSFLCSIADSSKAFNWYVAVEKEKLIAALNWWIHGDTLEIHFSVSQNREFDITNGIMHLLFELREKEISYLKMNLESQRKMTLVRLLSLGPKTYRNGYQTTLLIKPFVKGGNHAKL